MSLQELRTNLLKCLECALEPHGYQRREQSFRRPITGGWASFHVAFINHMDHFGVTGDVAVRHDAVEDRLNATNPHLSSREKRLTATVGAQLANIAGVGIQRWMVREPADVDVATENLLVWFKHWGMPFIERFSSTEEILRVLEEDGQEASLICTFPEQRRAVRQVLREFRDMGAD